MVYVVTYTLRPKRDATWLIVQLQRSPKWWHFLDDTWLIATHESAEQLWSRIAPNFLATDGVLIVQLTAHAGYFGWLPKEAWEWINENRSS
jgi:hypothetical protein